MFPVSPCTGGHAPKCMRARTQMHALPHRFRAQMEQLERFKGVSPESQGHTLVVTVLYKPDSLDSGVAQCLANAANLSSHGSTVETRVTRTHSHVLTSRRLGEQRQCWVLPAVGKGAMSGPSICFHAKVRSTGAAHDE